MSFKLWTLTIAIIIALFAVVPHIPGARAQSEAMCAPGFEWNQNSLGQDPCTVASDLEISCRSLDGAYILPPLNSTENYAPPNSTADLMCECNTVSYSLYMACTSCQGALLLTWPQWIVGCPSVSVAQYPYSIPAGTAVPHWAFLNVTALANQTYSDTAAKAAGRDPENKP